jgi:hypothetical protein
MVMSKESKIKEFQIKFQQLQSKEQGKKGRSRKRWKYEVEEN